MTPQDLAEVRARLEEFAAEVLAPFARDDQRRWGLRYVRGGWVRAAASRWSRWRPGWAWKQRPGAVDGFPDWQPNAVIA